MEIQYSLFWLKLRVKLSLEVNMLKKLFGVGAAAISTLIAACDGAPTTQQVYRRHDNVLSFLQESSAKGPMLLQVHGNPFVTSQEYLNDILAKELAESVTSLRGFSLTTDPAQSASGNARLVVVMGAKKSQSASDLCEGAPIETSTDDPIQSVAVFCIREDLYSEVRGSMKLSASPDDKAFRKWVSQIGRDLLMSAPILMYLIPDV